MEPNESGLNSYYHHHPPPLPPHPLQQLPNSATTAPTAATAGASPTNGILPNNNNNKAVSYPHSVPSAVSSPLEAVRRKRGRPRKYGTPEQAAAAKRLAAVNSGQNSAKKKDHSISGVVAAGGSVGGASPVSASSKKTQLAALGNAGQSFTPHIVTVSAGEDVGQKIMLFMQQNKRELCILSAAGSIANASLRQPATSGGGITYEGRFDILSLSGSYVRTELGGRTGGLSVCLSNTDGQIIGGGVGGPLTAAGPVQVIVGTFLIDSKKGAATGTKSDSSAGKLLSPVGGTSISSSGFHPAVDQQNFGGQFMIQPQNMQMTPPAPTDWRVGADARGNSVYDFTGTTGHHQSPENGDYEQMAD